MFHVVDFIVPLEYKQKVVGIRCIIHRIVYCSLGEEIYFINSQKLARDISHQIIIIYITHGHIYNQQENYISTKKKTKKTRKSFLRRIILKSLLMYDCSWTLEGADNEMLTRQWNRKLLVQMTFSGRN